MFYHFKDGALIAHVKVMPNADRDAIDGIVLDEYGRGYLRVRIKAVAEKGKANKALLKFLSKEWGCAPSELEIISKLTNNYKSVKIYANVAATEKLFAEMNNEI